MSDFKPVHVDLTAYQSRRLSELQLNEIYAQNWFKIFVPKKLNGLEQSLDDGLKILIESASIHGSLGWCVNLGSGAGYFYRFFSPETSEKIFSDQKAVIAGSGQPTGKAYKTDGGYLVSGNWDKCSGSAHATAFTGNAVFEDGKTHSLVFLRDQVTISETWQMFAMKATSSESFQASNVFVPDEFVFDIGIIKQDDTYPISEIPFEIFARFCMISTLIGTAICFCNHLESEFKIQIRSFETDYLNLRSKLESDQSSMLQLAKRYWSVADTKSAFTEHHHLNLKNGVSLISRSIFDAVNDLFYKAGIGLSAETSLAHHAYKDVLMAAQHSMMK